MKLASSHRPALAGLVAVGVLVAIGAAGLAHAQGRGQSAPPPGWRQIQVRPHVFTAGEVLKAGTYTVWVRIGDFPPGQEVDSNRVTVHRGGTWTRYPNVDFSRGGKPRHVTIYPDMIHDNTVNTTDFRDPRYGVPGKGEFILHIDNRSPTDTVTYVFEPMGRGGAPPEAAGEGRASGYPNATGTWTVVCGENCDGGTHLASVTTTGGRFHATASYRSHGDALSWTMDGTFDRQGKAVVVMTHSSAGKIPYTLQLSPDGKTFNFIGQNFHWVRR